MREGATIALGELHTEWSESLAIARQRPDLKALDAEVRNWFDARLPQRLVVQTE